jgi:hypothetical protein
VGCSIVECEPLGASPAERGEEVAEIVACRREPPHQTVISRVLTCWLEVSDVEVPVRPKLDEIGAASWVALI